MYDFFLNTTLIYDEKLKIFNLIKSILNYIKALVKFDEQHLKELVALYSLTSS